MVELAIQTYLESPNKESGVEASFVRINSTHGVKFYKSAKIRNVNYERQKLAAKHGLAPNVGQKLRIGKKKLYGFITETVTHLAKEEFGFKWDYSPAFRELINKLELVGFKNVASDLHWRNAGRMPDGRMVCIDFSEMFHPTIDEVPSYL